MGETKLYSTSTKVPRSDVATHAGAEIHYISTPQNANDKNDDDDDDDIIQWLSIAFSMLFSKPSL
jgi:hypothetical protein